MRKLAIAAVLLLVTGGAQAARLHCFSGGDSTCTVESNTSGILDVNAWGFSGMWMYYPKSLSGKVIGKLGGLSFTFDASEEGVAAGSPRFSIPIDMDKNGTTDGYAFIDASNCGYGPGYTGTGLVNTACSVVFLTETFDDWGDFVQAHPTYRFAPGAIPFIVADQPGCFYLTDIVLR